MWCLALTDCRQQAEGWAQHWPISLHTTEEWDNLTQVDRMSDSDIAGMCRHMETAIALVVGLAPGAPAGELPVAALVVDTVTSRVVASAAGHSGMTHGRGPIGHPVMVCLERLSAAHSDGRLREDAYLASGMTLYTTREPCPM